MVQLNLGSQGIQGIKMILLPILQIEQLHIEKREYLVKVQRFLMKAIVMIMLRWIVEAMTLVVLSGRRMK